MVVYKTWGVEPSILPPLRFTFYAFPLLRLLALLLGRRAGASYGLLLHLFLELQNAVEDRFRVGRAAGNIYVDRHHFVDTLHYCVRRERAARGGAIAHGDAPLGLGHLVPDGAHYGREFLGDRAAYEHHVALARGKAVEH